MKGENERMHMIRVRTAAFMDGWTDGAVQHPPNKTKGEWYKSGYRAGQKARDDARNKYLESLLRWIHFPLLQVPD